MRIIGGNFRNFNLVCQKGQKVRPTSAILRKTLFNVCQNCIKDSTFLDLFAGSGAVGLEAISRGAKFATFVDKDKLSIFCVKKNIEKLGVEDSCKIILGDSIQNLKRFIKKDLQFDIIFIDPPYNSPLYGQVFEIIDENPHILSTEGRVFVESLKNENMLKCFYLRKSWSCGKSILQEYRQNHEKSNISRDI